MIVRTWMKGFAAALLPVLLIPAAAVCAETSAPATQEFAARPSYFGINGTKAFHFSDPGSPVVAERLEWMRELGVRWDRTDLWWHVVEPEQGVYDWSRADRVFEVFDQAGVQWFPILCYGASWWKNRTAPRDEGEVAQFAEYVHQAVSRYKGRVRYWELWNEPNLANFWSPSPDPELYASLIRASSEAARRADPDVLLCAPVTAPLSGVDRKFIERLYQFGVLEHFDVFDYHYYRNSPPEQEVPAELAAIRALMARYGEEKPIWITETGVTSGVPTDAVIGGPVESGSGDSAPKYSYDMQAALLVRNHLLCLALGVERIFYFDLQNWFDDQPEVWDSTLGLVDSSGRKKPSFYAYQTLVRETDRRDFLGRCLSLAPGVEAVLIRDPESGRYTVAAWISDEERSSEVSLVCGPDEVRIVAPDGEVDMRPAESGAGQISSTRTVAVRLDHHPRYIEGVDGETYLADAVVELQPAHTILGPDEVRPLQVIATSSLLQSPEIRVVETTIPAGILWDPAGGLVQLAGEIRPGMYDVQALIEVTCGAPELRRTERLIRTARLEVVPALSVGIRPHRDWEAATTAGRNLLFDRPLLVEVALTNSSAREVTGVLTLLEHTPASSVPEMIGTELAPCILKPFETRHVHFAVPIERVRAYSDATTLTAEFGSYQSLPFHILPVPFSEEPLAPHVDGDLSDWPASIPPVQLDQERQINFNSAAAYDPADASADVRFWFTAERLYVAAAVRDDQLPHNANPPLKMWNGDALELYLGLCGPTRRTVINKGFEYQLGLAPTSADGKPSAFYFHEDVPLERTDLVVRPTENGFVMEASIALGELNSPVPVLTPGGLVALDAALDDVDTDDWAPAGNNRGRSMTWNGTPMNWIDPSGWGLAVLVPLDTVAGTLRVPWQKP